MKRINKIKKYLRITLFSLLGVFLSILPVFSISADDLYKKVYEYYDLVTPQSYEAELEGELITKQIKTIPADQIRGSLEDVTVVFYFKKGFGPKIYTKNIADFYKSMFSIFIPHLKLSGFYILLAEDEGLSGFKDSFIFTLLEEKEEEYIVLKVKEKDGDENEYAKFFLNKEKYFIEKAKYYKKDKLRFTSVLTYVEKGEYTYIEKIEYYNEKTSDARVSSSITFKNHKAIKIEDDFFK